MEPEYGVARYPEPAAGYLPGFSGYVEPASHGSPGASGLPMLWEAGRPVAPADTARRQFALILKRLIDIETAPTGFTTIAALVLFLGGVQLIGIGILGEYLARVYDEVKQRPVFLVKPRR
ncbi:MAG: hypothetical protein ABL879_14830 [Devosia sp.]